MAVTKTMGYQFLKEEADGEHDLTGAISLKIVLMTPAFAFNPATHSQYSDISASEIATGYGYTQKTKELENITNVETASGSTVGCDNVTWTASAGAIATTGSACIINDTHGNDTVICCIDFGADYSTTDGTLLQIDFTNGIFSKSNA